MALSDHPSPGQGPQADPPDPFPAGQLTPWFLQHRDQGWEAPYAPHQEHRPAWE